MKRLFKYLLIAVVVQLLGCTRYPIAPLGEEIIKPSEPETMRAISDLLTNNLKEQYKGQKFLRDTHPKDNGCIRGTFKPVQHADVDLQHGVFKPGKNYSVWMRFSNAVEELTDDEETDFRGLALKLTGVEGERESFLGDDYRSLVPNDEKHTQDFLFLGHDAFFAANQEEFFDFFDASFSGKTLWFLLTHPKGAYNIFKGKKQFINPLNIKWNSVAAYGLGKPNNGKYKTVVRYALRSCAVNSGEIPEPPTPDYLRENLAKQLDGGTACLDFFVQKQVDPKAMPVENALVQWSEEKSPFIKVARIDIPSQTFDSQAQKDFCENLSFNPWHSLKVHHPMGSINRARRPVMKNVSDLRLQHNGVTRTEPTGKETFD